MATFQLPGLPSQQIENQTAGGLGLPTVPQYAERPNTGVMLAQGLGAISERLAANKQQQADADFMKSFGAAYAANDRDAMKQLAAAHPEQIERIQKGMGFIDQDRNQVIGQAAMDLRLAAKSGDQSLMSSLQKNAPVLNQMGLSPEEAFLSYKQDPKQFDQITDLISMHALGPEKYFDIQDKMTARDIDREKLNLTLRGQNISAQNAALEREIKKAELQNNVLDRQIARETNALKLDELRQKQADAQQKTAMAKADRQATAQGAVDTFRTALDSLNELEKSRGLSKAVGVNSVFPTIPGTEAATFEARLDTFKAQTFLPMVASLKGMGALSDAEGKKLSDAVGALSLKMSDKAFRSSLGKIKGQLESKLSNVKKQFDYREPNSPSVPQHQTSFSSLWGD